MGVVIQGTAVARPTAKPWSHGARRLADAAAKACLEAAGAAAPDVDMLINAGVYRERGLGEPALAALIQEDVRANPGGVLGLGGQGTFSFDIDNGACGVLTGVHLLRGFLTSGAIRSGLVVTSDSGPGPRHARWFPAPEAGAAMLLGPADGDTGFTALSFATFPEYADRYEGYWEWRPSVARPARQRAGRNRLVVVERPGFRARAVECAYESTGKFLAAHGVAAAEVDLLVATPEDGFADALADRLGVAHERTLHLGEQLRRVHTAQPIAAIDLARRTGRWEAARTILVVSAGSGITIASALYRP